MLIKGISFFAVANWFVVNEFNKSKIYVKSLDPEAGNHSRLPINLKGTGRNEPSRLRVGVGEL